MPEVSMTRMIELLKIAGYSQERAEEIALRETGGSMSGAQTRRPVFSAEYEAKMDDLRRRIDALKASTAEVVQMTGGDELAPARKAYLDSVMAKGKAPNPSQPRIINVEGLSDAERARLDAALSKGKAPRPSVPGETQRPGESRAEYLLRIARQNS